MITEGKFNRSCHPLWLAQPLGLIASVAVVVAMVQGETARDTFVDIPGAKLPLADAAPMENTRSAHVTLEVRGVSGVKLTLVNTDSMDIYGAEVIGEDGTCVFRDIPDGTYRFVASLISGTADVDVGTWIVAGGKAELVYGGDSKGLWKGVDVKVCLTK